MATSTQVAGQSASRPVLNSCMISTSPVRGPLFRKIVRSTLGLVGALSGSCFCLVGALSVRFGSTGAFGAFSLNANALVWGDVLDALTELTRCRVACRAHRATVASACSVFVQGRGARWLPVLSVALSVVLSAALSRTRLSSKPTTLSGQDLVQGHSATKCLVGPCRWPVLQVLSCRTLSAVFFC